MISAINKNNISFTSVTPIRGVYVAETLKGALVKDSFKLTTEKKEIKSTKINFKKILTKKDPFEQKSLFTKSVNMSIRQLLSSQIKDYVDKTVIPFTKEDISFFHHNEKCFLLTGSDAIRHHKVGAALGRAKADLSRAIKRKDDNINEHKIIVEEYEKYYAETLKEFYKKANYSKQLEIFGVRKSNGGIQVASVSF